MGDAAQRGPGLWAKRALDVAVSGAVLAVVSPVLAVTAAAVAASMGTPVLFRQKRPGFEGRPFELLKFRTMRDVRPGEDMLASDADRITRVGQFLRSTSLDELPTLLNVLKGDMSLVGPRPLLMRYLPLYSQEQARRHDVIPGVTGWAQINGRNTISWEQKFAYDVWYVDHWSFLLDLKILVTTALKVLRRSDISHAGHVTMPAFTGTPEVSS